MTFSKHIVALIALLAAATSTGTEWVSRFCMPSIHGSIYHRLIYFVCGVQPAP